MTFRGEMMSWSRSLQRGLLRSGRAILLVAATAVVLGGTQCGVGPGLGSESHFLTCGGDSECPIGVCRSGYCEKDGERVTREQVEAHEAADGADSGQDSGLPDTSPDYDVARSGDGGRACEGSTYPSPVCSGVPEDTPFVQTVEGQYIAATDGETLDRWHITGNLVIRAAGVTIRNSQIDGSVTNEYEAAVFGGPFTIADSTIGLPTGCVMGPGVADHDYTAIRVHVRGHEDGFRAGGPDVTIRDSYVKNCLLETVHGNGIQDYPYTRNLIFDHNTIDACGEWTNDRSKSCQAPGANSAIYVASDPAAGNGSTNVRITNNLVMGGAYSLHLLPQTQGRGGTSGTWVVTGNRVVDGTWAYGSYETLGNCGSVAEWSDNTVVTMDRAYTVTSTVREEPCPN